MIYAAVFLLSLASLAYEVLLPRVFAFSQWHHLAFLVISVAVFGFGAGGALVSLVEDRRGPTASRLAEPARAAGLAGLCLLFCLSAAGSLLFLLSVPLDYFRLPVEPRQAGYLVLSWLLLLLPFLLAGAVQALAFAALPRRSGWLYAAGMAGGACGALLPPVLLGRVEEVPLALGCLVLPALPWVLLPLQRAVPRRSAWLLACAALAAAAAPLWWPPAAGRWWPAAANPRPSPYKLLAQAGQLAGTRHLGTENGPAGRVDWLDSPALRFVPGLSLAYPGGLPQPLQAVVDGDALLQLFPLQEPSRLAFCGYTTSYAAYALREDWAGARALLLLESGGLTPPCAVLAGAGSITVVLRQPAVARRLRDLAPGLRVLTGNPRAVLAGSPAGSPANLRESFDLVQLESWGSSAPGAASLEQDHLLTTEALAASLRRLTPGGLLSISRRIQLPPSDSLRLFSAAFEALRSLGVREPGRHIAMLRSWDTYTLIAGRRPFGPGELGRLARFCEQMSFDLLFLEGLREEQANRFVRYERPYHYLELRRLGDALAADQAGAPGAEGAAAGYYRGYLLDVRPATDEKPFPNRFLKPGRAGQLYRATGSRPFSLLLSGEAVLLATLALSLAIGLPLLRVSSRRGPPGLGYFLACGAGYMWVEMGAIQDLTFLFAEPATAVAVALASLLVFSGAGAAVSARWREGGQRRALAALLAVLGALLALRPPALAAALALAPAWRLAAAALALGPAGFLMGIPLPVGLRRLEGAGRWRAQAWAANGIAGVLASVLSLPLAMAAGIRWVYAAGAAAYLAAFLAVRAAPAVPAAPGRRKIRTPAARPASG